MELRKFSQPILKINSLHIFIFHSYPLSKFGYGINWQEALVISYSGLRGAMALVLALVVSHQDTIDEVYYNNYYIYRILVKNMSFT